MIGSDPSGSRGASDARGSTAKVIRVIYIDSVPHLLCSEEMGWFNNIRREVTFATRITSASMLRRVRSELSAGDAIEIDAVDGHPGMILRDFRVQSGGQGEQELPVSVWPNAARRLDALLESVGTAAEAPQINTSSRQTSEFCWNRLFPEASETEQGLQAVVGQDRQGTRGSSDVDTIAMQIVRDAAAGIQSRDAVSKTDVEAGALHLRPAIAGVLRAIRRVLGSA